MSLREELESALEALTRLSDEWMGDELIAACVYVNTPHVRIQYDSASRALEVATKLGIPLRVDEEHGAGGHWMLWEPGYGQGDIEVSWSGSQEERAALDTEAVA